MEDARLIANPYLLANEKSNYKINKMTIFDKLKIFLNESYKDIYFSDKKIIEIENIINDQIKEIIIDQFITECLDSCIENIIEENKFDFCIPFD